MDCWKILSIEATADTSEIKRAYAKQLKLINIDQETQRFIELRQAFEQALNFVAGHTELDNATQQEILNWQINPDLSADAESDCTEHVASDIQTNEYNTEISNTAPLAKHHSNTRHPQSNELKLRIDQLSLALLSWQLDDVIYIEFEALCTELDDAQLSSQLYFKEQILPVLTDIELSPLDARYMRFLIRWYQRYPEDVILYSEDDDQLSLQQKIIACLHHRSLWLNIPAELQSTVTHLSGDQAFQPWTMLKLQYDLVQYLGFSTVLKQLSYLQQPDIDRNPNYLYLKSLNTWYKSLWAILVFGLNSFFLLHCLNLPLHINILVSLILTLGYFPMFQAPLQAIICARKKQDQFLENFSLLWFLSGLAILASTALLTPIWHLSLSYLWLVISLVFITSLQLAALPYMNSLLQSDFYETDRWVMLLGCFGVILIATTAFYLLGQPNYPWVINYSLIALSLFFFPDSLTGLAQRCSATVFSALSILNIKTTILRSLSVLMLRFSTIFMAVLFFSTGANKIYLLLACLSYGCLLLTMLQARWLSSTLKYVSYAVLCILSLPTLFFPIYLTYYATQSFKHRQKIVDTL